MQVGKNRWYVRVGAKSSVLYKVRRGRVREIGIANRRLTRNRRVAKRFFRQFERR